MVDLLLIFSLGFLGSFGHCIGMCGPVTAAFSLSRQTSLPQETSQREPDSWWQQLWFHGLLNLGRILSYGIVGAGIGALGSVLVAGGQVAGVGSDLRRGIAILTGSLLIWFGIVQLNPTLLPHIPFLNPMGQGSLHERLGQAMTRLSLHSSWWTPLALGLVWGLIPCGFLYAAQIKAAETADLWKGSLTMLAFGLGTLPTMLGIGIVSGWLSRDRRSQLFRLGGWITLLIGILTILRTGDGMVDYSGFGAIICLFLALVARPISRLWTFPLQYRRALGVGAFVLSMAHTIHMLEHSWSWNPSALLFMLPQHRWGIVSGMMAFLLLIPLTATSIDRAQHWLGIYWRRLHLLAVPALILASLHCLMVGTHFLGRAQLNWVNGVMVALLVIALVAVFLVRSPAFWSLLSLREFYVPPKTR